MVLASDMDIDYLKFSAEWQAEHLHLTEKASKELRKLLLDENISTLDFQARVQELFTQTTKITLPPYLIRIFSGFKNIFFQIAWSEIFIFLAVAIFLYFFYQQFKTNKIVGWILVPIGNVLVNLCCATGYIFPFIEMMNIYTPTLVRTHPYLKWVLTYFIKISVFIYPNIPQFGFFYFCAVYAFFIRNRIPRNRLIRYHYALGLMIMQLHNPIAQIYVGMIRGLGRSNKEDLETISMVFFLVIMCYFLPCVYRALRGEYTKNAFLRDAVEIILGRDLHDPDFKWWDR